MWPRLHQVHLAGLHGADALDFSRTSVDGFHVLALKGAQGGTKPC
ncbi:hypothetical protein AB0M42_24760 [Streptomyces sp. NPDC051784]